MIRRVMENHISVGDLVGLYYSGSGGDTSIALVLNKVPLSIFDLATKIGEPPMVYEDVSYFAIFLLKK
jgi:hypothetical protein